MLFNSFAFIVFLPAVFAVYWLCGRRLRLQNLFVVVASYVFYGWWDWRFLLLITLTAIWAWASGLVLERLSGVRERKVVVAGALIVNIGILAAFKYYNFFAENVGAFLEAFGIQSNLSSLKIILPVGISFYTFQALSYVIDVYRKDICPTKDLVAFVAFVSFFPQLVAGPIERATNLLPQFLSPRRFDYPLAVDGCRQMLWGFFKKVLVADSCALAANGILGNPCPSSVSLWIGMFFFAFQIYGDFSGYSDIAIGCSKLFGIQLMRNFNMPYFSRDIAEFWRRWHISLTTWFRDYLYIPLGGSRCCFWRKVRNTFIVFLVSGFWHGANWTFVAWGAFHAACFLPLLATGKNRVNVSDVVAAGRMIPTPREVIQMLLTFALVVLGWTLFRAPNITTAWKWIFKMMTFSDIGIKGIGLAYLRNPMLVVLPVLIVVEWCNRCRPVPALPRNRMLRWCLYYFVIIALLFFHPVAQTFIYFKF